MSATSPRSEGHIPLTRRERRLVSRVLNMNPNVTKEEAIERLSANNWKADFLASATSENNMSHNAKISESALPSADNPPSASASGFLGENVFSHGKMSSKLNPSSDPQNNRWESEKRIQTTSKNSNSFFLASVDPSDKQSQAVLNQSHFKEPIEQPPVENSSLEKGSHEVLSLFNKTISNAKAMSGNDVKSKKSLKSNTISKSSIKPDHSQFTGSLSHEKELVSQFPSSQKSTNLPQGTLDNNLNATVFPMTLSVKQESSSLTSSIPESSLVPGNNCHEVSLSSVNPKVSNVNSYTTQMAFNSVIPPPFSEPTENILINSLSAYPLSQEEILSNNHFHGGPPLSPSIAPLTMGCPYALPNPSLIGESSPFFFEPNQGLTSLPVARNLAPMVIPYVLDYETRPWLSLPPYTQKLTKTPCPFTFTSEKSDLLEVVPVSVEVPTGGVMSNRHAFSPGETSLLSSHMPSRSSVIWNQLPPPYDGHELIYSQEKEVSVMFDKCPEEEHKSAEMANLWTNETESNSSPMEMLNYPLSHAHASMSGFNGKRDYEKNTVAHNLPHPGGHMPENSCEGRPPKYTSVSFLGQNIDQENEKRLSMTIHSETDKHEQEPPLLVGKGGALPFQETPYNTMNCNSKTHPHSHSTEVNYHPPQVVGESPHALGIGSSISSFSPSQSSTLSTLSNVKNDIGQRKAPSNDPMTHPVYAENSRTKPRNIQADGFTSPLPQGGGGRWREMYPNQPISHGRKGGGGVNPPPLYLNKSWNPSTPSQTVPRRYLANGCSAIDRRLNIPKGNTMMKSPQHYVVRKEVASGFHEGLSFNRDHIGGNHHEDSLLTRQLDGKKMSHQVSEEFRDPLANGSHPDGGNTKWDASEQPRKFPHSSVPQPVEGFLDATHLYQEAGVEYSSNVTNNNNNNNNTINDNNNSNINLNNGGRRRPDGIEICGNEGQSNRGAKQGTCHLGVTGRNHNSRENILSSQENVCLASQNVFGRHYIAPPRKSKQQYDANESVHFNRHSYIDPIISTNYSIDHAS